MSILSNGSPQIALARLFERVSVATGKDISSAGSGQPSG